MQDINKYGAPKYRLVVRFTNTDIICQIVRAKITGDFVIAAAYSHELVNYGIKHGLTNYAAAYSTGLLIARRILKKFKLDNKYIGLTEANGEDYTVEPLVGDDRPLYVLMDVGLARTSTGNRIFGVMKGALDGGLNIPHSNTRFVGYFKDSGEPSGAFHPEVLRKYIYGGHIAEYMEKLQQDNPDAYQRQFSRYIKDSISPEMLEEIYRSAHTAIRANPMHVKSQRPDSAKVSKYPRKTRLTLEQRKARISKKLSDKSRSKLQREVVSVS